MYRTNKHFKILEKIINTANDHLEFEEGIHKHGDNVFEALVAVSLKAKLPGDVYWLDEDVVPPSIAKQFKVDKILRKKDTPGMDVLHIHQDMADGYESKYQHNEKNISLGKVGPKTSVLKNTDVNQLIICTNSKNLSRNVKKFESDTGLLPYSYWFSKENFEIVKNYIHTKQTKKYQPLQPRDNFFKDALAELHRDVNKLKKQKSVRIFQHWPASSGKSTFARLAFDKTFSKKFNKGQEINCTVTPNLTILSTNLIPQIEHDMALANSQMMHVIYATNIEGMAKDTEQLQLLRHKTNIISDRKQFYKFLKKHSNKTLWFHTTMASYPDLARQLKSKKKQIFFSHIDEVHHCIQPEGRHFASALDDACIKVRYRFMSSANKRIAIDKSVFNFCMDDKKFADVYVKKLKEKLAVKLGYKRQTKVLNYQYNQDLFDNNSIEMLDKGKNPFVKIRNTNLDPVPLTWVMAVNTLIQFRIEHPFVNHTMITCNEIDQCKAFSKFFVGYKKIILKHFLHSNNPMYRRLLKAKVMVADTHSNNTPEILKKVNSIPHNPNIQDSFLLHCQLLGEGWSPERGWLDSSFFLYPSSSEIKIYQIHMRTVRNGDNKKNSYAVIQSLITDKFDKTNTKYNNAFKMTKTVLDALEIGQDDISELVSFRKFINLPAGKKSLGSGNTTQNTHLSELDSNLVSKAFVNYVKEGHYYPYAQSVNEIVEWWCDTVTDNIDTMCWGRSSKSYIEKVGVKATIKKFKDYFDNFTAAESLREKIITGSHWLVSEKNIERIADVEELMITVKQKMIQNIRRDASAGYQRQLVNHSQHNFWFRDVLKKYNMQDTPHLIFKNTYDIVETFEKQKHFDKQKMKIVKLIMQNITKVKSANELVSLIISKLDNVGIEPQKVLNESFFKRNFIEQDRYKVFSTTQRTKFKQLRKAINQQGKHGNNIAWNKGKNYTFAELRKKRNIA